MSDGIYSALSGAIAQQRALDVVANNVANAGTVGYRADALAFREAVSRAPGGPNPDGLRYVAIARETTDGSDGPLIQTDNPLDLALSGDGLFAVQTDDGVRYTRAGAFRLDADGVVRTAGGHALLAAGGEGGEGGPITIPPGTNDIRVDAAGTVSADGQEVGRIRIERFADGQLQKQGLTLFVPQGQAQGQPAEEVTVHAGYLEGANVSPIGGMNELITASRSFEAFQRVIQAFRQIDERAARDVGSNG
ncbi:MAG: flagellar basal-body rod protein FlgF [Myxococcales bacterium]|nr:flagellar basal-body rod protein FlgF [Myxococcales bacterium]